MFILEKTCSKLSTWLEKLIWCCSSYVLYSENVKEIDRQRKRERERDFIVAYILNRTMIHGWLWLLTNIALPYLGIAPENERTTASLCSTVCFLLPRVAACDPSIPADLFSTTNMMFPHLCSTSLHSPSSDEKKTFIGLSYLTYCMAFALFLIMPEQQDNIRPDCVLLLPQTDEEHCLLAPILLVIIPLHARDSQN